MPFLPTVIHIKSNNITFAEYIYKIKWILGNIQFFSGLRKYEPVILNKSAICWLLEWRILHSHIDTKLQNWFDCMKSFLFVFVTILLGWRWWERYGRYYWIAFFPSQKLRSDAIRTLPFLCWLTESWYLKGQGQLISTGCPQKKRSFVVFWL